MLYYHIPLGGAKAEDSKHQFGLRLDQTTHDPRNTVHINMLEKRQAAADFRFGYSGMQSLKIHGVDYSGYLVARADAGDEDVKVMEEQAAEEAIEDAITEEGQEAVAEEAGVDQEEKTEDEKGTVQKTLDELPAGVIFGVILGLGILIGVGG